MNKENLIAAITHTMKVQHHRDVSKEEVRDFIDSFCHVVEDSLSDGDDVTLVNWGKFSVRATPERQGRNPQNGQPITIPACNRVTFVPGKKLKKAVNQ